MTGASDQARKAADTLSLGEQDGTADETTADDVDQEESSEPDESSTSEPDGWLDRAFRTDRELDLSDSVPWWDPENGGINRIGAAIKQAGGWKAMPPIVWVPIGVAEAIYVFLHARGLVPGTGGESSE